MRDLMHVHSFSYGDFHLRLDAPADAGRPCGAAARLPLTTFCVFWPTTPMGPT